MLRSCLPVPLALLSGAIMLEHAAMALTVYVVAMGIQIWHRS